ncbi:MAG TPA: SDR family NAD(P)-dependent oxidoreductase [Drouetiella sp.]|jgi:NAD(P)-dependent dehydrogenase (short-subunit alcohol dehydrogenase family)
MDDLVALVTGGGSGIGFSTARLLLEMGARVMIVGRDLGKLKHAAELLGYPTERLRTTAGDVSSEGYANKIVRDTIAAFGRLDILVNNAGVFQSQSLLDMSEEDFDYIVDINLKGTWFMCKFAARPLIETAGSIVNVSSMLAMQSFHGMPSSAYSAAKGGVLALTRELAVELAPHKVRCNAVLPALVNTPLLENLMGHENADRMLEKSKKIYPLGRAGEPEDVARTICFLADPRNGWITGAELKVDGGIHLV